MKQISRAILTGTVLAVALATGAAYGFVGLGAGGDRIGAGAASPGDPVVPVRAGGELETREITSGGRTRTYHLYVPPGIRFPAPLVVVFHGGGGEPLPFVKRIGIREMAADHGYVIAAPVGLDESWNTLSIDPQGWSEENGIDDVGFVRDMLSEIAAEGLSDPSRVYAMGMSRGGMMSYTVGCELPGRFAAIASVSGPLSSGRCDNVSNVSVLHIHGDADRRVPFEGGDGEGTSGYQNWFSSRQGLAIFAANAQCTGEWAASRVTDDTVCYQTSCPGSREVQYCLIEGGGHAWPGGQATMRQKAQGASSSQSFDATTVIGNFFARH